MSKLLTPESLAAIAKAKPIGAYERGQGFDVLRLSGSRVLYVSHLNKGPSYADDAEFAFSTLSIEDKLVLDDELVLSATTVMLRLTTGFGRPDQKDELTSLRLNGRSDMVTVGTFEVAR